MIEQFKILCDGLVAKIEPSKDDVAALEEYLGISFSGDYSVVKLMDRLRQNIIDSVSIPEDDNGISFREMRRLEKALIYETVLFGANNFEYIGIVDIFRQVGRKSLPLSHEKEWRIAILNAKDMMVVDHENKVVTSHNLRRFYPKAFDVATACRRLVDYGVVFEIDDFELKAVSGSDALVNKLEGTMKEIGGANVLRFIFEHMAQQSMYHSEARRFVFPRPTNNDPQKPIQLIPFGFLVNLAAKHVMQGEADRGTVPNLKDKLDYISQVSRLLFATKGLLYYTMFHTTLQSVETIEDYLKETALFDSTYSIFQSSVDIEHEYLPVLLEWVPEGEFYSFFRFSIKDYITVAKFILYSARDTIGPVVVYGSRIKKAHKDIPEGELDLILKEMSLESGAVNNEYVFFEDFEKINLTSRPLIALTSTKFLLCDKAWMGASFYEGMMERLRTVHDGKVFKIGDPDKIVGKRLEEVVFQMLSRKGISFSSGKYEGAVKGDCDVLIETESTVILVEVKKKQLSRNARAGKATHIFLDLASSLLHAQQQAARSELQLRKEGFLKLTRDDQAPQTVFLNGRTIERIALTQYDFSSLQDKMFVSTFFRILSGATFDLVDKSDVELVRGFQFLRDMSAQFNDYMRELGDMEERYKRGSFFECWFFSLPQFALILDDSTDNESFYQNLTKTKYISLDAQNFYFEYSKFPKK